MISFTDKLQKACEKNRSLLCVGLDPDPELMPIKEVFEFNKAIIEATWDLVCAYKPNIGFYEATGVPGLEALVKTREYIPTDIPVIIDAKRGDTVPTARFYAKALLETWGFDAVTVNPYLGQDSVEPFLSYPDKGVFVLCRTSNPGARELQDLELTMEREVHRLYEWVALRASSWNTKGNVGLVMGATYPEEIRRVRELCPEMPLLIPGIGPQQGALELSVCYGVDAHGRNAIINSSRGVIYASRDRKVFAQAARQQALALRDQINAVLEKMGNGWDS